MSPIWFAVWFFLPAGVANVVPIFLNKVPLVNRFKTPIDMGRCFRGIRIFGDNKTWRGLLGGVFLAVITAMIQRYFAARSTTMQSLGGIDYTGSEVLLLGGLLGFGALMGDAIESFFKRRVNVPPGETWFPFDQTDYIIGGLLASLPVVRLDVIEYVLIIVLWFAVHLAASYLGFLLKLKAKPL